MNFEEAELYKRAPQNHAQLFPLVRPVMEKVATIVEQHVARHHVDQLFLVGGTSSFTGIAEVIKEVTGIQTTVAPHPMFVTPFGVAMYDS
jgi:ethanolamine utilization protein EutJ